MKSWMFGKPCAAGSRENPQEINSVVSDSHVGKAYCLGRPRFPNNSFGPSPGGAGPWLPSKGRSPCLCPPESVRHRINHEVLGDQIGTWARQSGALSRPEQRTPLKHVRFQARGVSSQDARRPTRYPRPPRRCPHAEEVRKSPASIPGRGIFQ